MIVYVILMSHTGRECQIHVERRHPTEKCMECTVSREFLDIKRFVPFLVVVANLIH